MRCTSPFALTIERLVPLKVPDHARTDVWTFASKPASPSGHWTLKLNLFVPADASNVGVSSATAGRMGISELPSALLEHRHSMLRRPG